MSKPLTCHVNTLDTYHIILDIAKRHQAHSLNQGLRYACINSMSLSLVIELRIVKSNLQY